MKIKLDENLPDRLVTVFTGLGHDVDTVPAEQLTRPGRNALFERVSTVFQTEKVEVWTGSLVVATEQKIRVRRWAEPTER